ncbi:MAG TPA: hypothetical protein VHK86_00755 [Nitrososphaera sp.]|nr:hypothetical protein [Nitrososphaera sp.]
MGNPYHDKEGKFTTGPEGRSKGNREVASHIAKQHSVVDKISQARTRQARNQGYGIPGRDLLNRKSEYHTNREAYLKKHFPKEFN